MKEKRFITGCAAFAAVIWWILVVIGFLADRDLVTIGTRIFQAVVWTAFTVVAYRHRW